MKRAIDWLLLPAAMLLFVAAVVIWMPYRIRDNDRAWTAAKDACERIPAGAAKAVVLEIGRSTVAEMDDRGDSIRLGYRYRFSDDVGLVALLESGAVKEAFFDFP